MTAPRRFGPALLAVIAAVGSSGCYDFSSPALVSPWDPQAGSSVPLPVTLSATGTADAVTIDWTQAAPVSPAPARWKLLKGACGADVSSLVTLAEGSWPAAGTVTHSKDLNLPVGQCRGYRLVGVSADGGHTTQPSAEATITPTTCAAGLEACSGFCVDPKSDAANCGACGKNCATTVGTGATCQASVCKCPGSQAVCGNRCVDQSNDVTACGQTCAVCSAVVGAGASCQSGTCICLQPVLTVTEDGSGHGSVVSSPPGIRCPGGSCSAAFPNGTSVTLTQTPSASWFSGWSGACSGSDACVLKMEVYSTVNATFVAGTRQFLVAVALTGLGKGTVVSSPPGINCPGTCSANFDAGSLIRLTATPDGISAFDGFSGDCSQGACSYTLTGDSAVSAAFSLLDPATTITSVVIGGPHPLPIGLGVRAQVPVTATFLDGHNSLLAPEAVDWSSSAPSVVAPRAGWLVALGGGNTQVTAVAGGKADLLSVTVAAPPSMKEWSHATVYKASSPASVSAMTAWAQTTAYKASSPSLQTSLTGWGKTTFYKASSASSQSVLNGWGQTTIYKPSSTSQQSTLVNWGHTVVTVSQ